MSRKFFKVFAWAVGIVLLGFIALFTFLILDSGGSKDHLVEQKASPDGRLIAEIHQNITPQHGGPDTLYVTLRQASHPHGDEIYSRTYECSDLSAFHLEWEGPNELRLAYGSCNSGRWHTKDENAIGKSDDIWQDVRIIYEDTQYVATH